jgi:hypothetical protein
MGSPTQKMWITTPITIILKREGKFDGSRKRNDDAVHEEVNGDAI